MIAGLLLAVLCAAPRPAVPGAKPDSLPQVTLEEALRRAARLDPDYVRTLGQIDDAEWARRAALLAFFVPSLSVGLDETKYSQSFFNPADPANPTSTLVVGRASASYEIFSLEKVAELSRSKAELESAGASELAQRYRTGLATESSYYGVAVHQELIRVAEARVARAREGLTVARARVVSGAVVQSDSLQFVLELTRAELDLLRQRDSLLLAQLELGRRIGAAGPVDAAPLDLSAPELPLGLAEATRLALEQGPEYRAAQAQERAAEASLRARRGDYLPRLALDAVHQRYDTRIFPGASNISSITVGLSFPIWDNGRREIEITRARVSRDVARAIREDLARATRRDVTRAYQGYLTSRRGIELAGLGVTVARETYRVQEQRYRSGATDILQLLDAQVDLARAEGDLARARSEARRALAGLEAILGRRLFTDKGAP